MKNERGYFVLSLDFESMWGSIGSKNVQGFIERTKNEEEIVAKLIDILNDFDIHSTWATVAALSCNSKEDVLSQLKNDIKYAEWDISMNEYIEKTTKDYYFPDLVKMLSSYKNIELASHTFTHSYFLSSCLSNNDIENELEKSKLILSRYGDIETIVFPRNQINDCVFSTLKKYGYTIYRGNINRLCNNNKYLEFLNSFLPITNKVSYHLKKISIGEYGVLNIPASLFLRIYKRNDLKQKIHIMRIKHEMKKSAKKGLIFHLWFHPHNIGTNVQNGIKVLETILNYYKKMQLKYSYKSVNMRELKQIVIEGGIC